MSDLQPPQRNISRDEPASRPPPVPRWVKASGISIALLLLVLVIALLLGGNHGPGRHLNSASVEQPARSSTWYDADIWPEGIRL